VPLHIAHTLEIQGSFPPVSRVHQVEVVMLSLNVAVCKASVRSISTQSREHPEHPNLVSKQ